MLEHSTRRQFLSTTAVVAATTVAGCTGGGSEGDQSTDETNEMTTEDQMGTTEDAMATDDDSSEGTMESTSASFTVRIENVSESDTLETMDGGTAVPLSPAAYAVHEGDNPLFARGEAASDHLEALAEDGVAGGLADETAMDAETAAAATVPVGGDEPRPIGPGEAYEFTVEASGDQRLSLATMFVQSNDLFYAPGESGIPLFDDGDAVHGDVTDSLQLWDAGTEQNQPPGEGGDQAPRQMEAGAGAAEDETVRSLMDVQDGHDYPPTGDVIRVTVSPETMDG